MVGQKVVNVLLLVSGNGEGPPIPDHRGELLEVRLVEVSQAVGRLMFAHPSSFLFGAGVSTALIAFITDL